MSKIVDKNYIAKCEKYYLRPGYIYVAKEPTVITTVLGSCVSVCMYDKKNKYGGMNHYLLPKRQEKDEPTSKFANISIIQLYKAFIELNSNPNDLTAQIIGGAFAEGSLDSKYIASKNVLVCKKILNSLDVKTISEDIGGILGRKVIYFTETNESIITKLQTIRSTDFIVEY